MNLALIQEYLRNICASADDPETAHELEDELYYNFVKHVADTAEHGLAELAKAVLATSNIEFPRWRA